MKKLLFLTVAMLFIAANAGFALTCEELDLLVLPIEDATALVEWGTNSTPPVNSYFALTISDDGVLDGGPYLAWCIEKDADINPKFPWDTGATYDGIYEVDIDVAIPGVDIPNEVLWLLNNDDGLDPGDVQAVIWMFYEGPAVSAWAPTSSWPHGWGLDRWGNWDGLDPIANGGDGDGTPYEWSPTQDDYQDDLTRIQAIYDTAATHSDFVPGCDDVWALLVIPTDGESQVMIMEVTIPCCAAEGCTPGFWKNNWDKKGGNAWEGSVIIGTTPTPLAGTLLFDEVFGVDVTLRGKGKTTYDDPTLVQALDANGGGINALARHATAALLNTTSGCTLYPYSTAGLIEAVHDAIIAGDEAIDALHIKLAGYNEASACPINQKGICQN